jgi:hypothetical protein
MPALLPDFCRGNAVFPFANSRCSCHLTSGQYLWGPQILGTKILVDTGRGQKHLYLYSKYKLR